MSVKKDENRQWRINDLSNDGFDGVITAVGARGDLKMPHLQDQEALMTGLHLPLI